MKYITVILLFCVACTNPSSSNSANTTAAANSSTQPSKLVKDGPDLKVKNEKGVKAPTGEENVLGGPAKFEIKLNEPFEGRVLLINTFADQNVKLDSAMVSSDHTIRFERESSYAQGLYFVVFPDNKLIQVLLGEDQKFTMQCSKSDPVKDMVVNGSIENEIFYKASKFEAGHKDKITPFTNALKAETEGTDGYAKAKAARDVIVKERTDYLDNIFKKHPDILFTKFKLAGQNPTVRTDVTNDEKVYFYRKEFWDTVDFGDNRLLRTPVINNKLKRYFKELTAQNPDSIKSSTDLLLNKLLDHPIYYQFIANWIVFQYEPAKSTLMDSEAVFVHMIQNYFTYNRAFWSDSTEVYGLQLRAFEMSQSLIGQQAPDVVSFGPDGSEKRLYDLEAEYIVVYMYNPTCEHCAIQSPKLSALWKEKHKSGILDVYAIAIDTDEAEWKDYIKKNDFQWENNVFDPTNKSIYAKYYVNVTPELYLLNKERKIVGKNLKADQIMEMIERDR